MKYIYIKNQDIRNLLNLLNIKNKKDIRVFYNLESKQCFFWYKNSILLVLSMKDIKFVRNKNGVDKELYHISRSLSVYSGITSVDKLVLNLDELNLRLVNFYNLRVVIDKKVRHPQMFYLSDCVKLCEINKKYNIDSLFIKFYNKFKDRINSMEIYNNSMAGYLKVSIDNGREIFFRLVKDLWENNEEEFIDKYKELGKMISKEINSVLGDYGIYFRILVLGEDSKRFKRLFFRVINKIEDKEQLKVILFRRKEIEELLDNVFLVYNLKKGV